MREFLYVDDMAAACVHVMELDEEVHRANTYPMLSHINIGTGRDCTVRKLAVAMARVTGIAGRILFDASRLEGAPRKFLDVSCLQALGWRAGITLEDGLRNTYQWFLKNREALRQ